MRLRICIEEKEGQAMCSRIVYNVKYLATQILEKQIWREARNLEDS